MYRHMSHRSHRYNTQKALEYAYLVPKEFGLPKQFERSFGFDVKTPHVWRPMLVTQGPNGGKTVPR